MIHMNDDCKRLTHCFITYAALHQTSVTDLGCVISGQNHGTGLFGTGVVAAGFSSKTARAS
jgi:hypothetical protein